MNNNSKTLKIILAAGGTGGPVAPLVAVASHIRTMRPGVQFLLLGSNSSVEKRFAEKYNLEFKTIPAGKFRRYFSFKNILSPFLVFAGIIKALFVINKFKPDLLFSVGGFVSVPVMIAAWISRKKIVIHQQDVIATLSNKIIAPLATKITVTFDSSIKDFPSSSGLFTSKNKEDKIVWTGNPFREDILEAQKLDPEDLKNKYKLNFDLPVLLVVGGATGAAGLNQILKEALPELTKYVQILHITGKDKGLDLEPTENYHPIEFTDSIGELYYISDVVVSRAGLSTITELSALKKVAIVVPMPESHQEANALVLAAAKAAICVLQEDLNPEKLVLVVRNIIHEFDLQKTLKQNISEIMPKDATEKVSKIILDLCQEKK